jgi:hypothetical protein
MDLLPLVAEFSILAAPVVRLGGFFLPIDGSQFSNKRRAITYLGESLYIPIYSLGLAI